MEARVLKANANSVSLRAKIFSEASSLAWYEEGMPQDSKKNFCRLPLVEERNLEA